MSIRAMPIGVWLVAAVALAGCGGGESASSSDHPLDPLEPAVASETATELALRPGSADELVTSVDIEGEYCNVLGDMPEGVPEPEPGSDGVVVQDMAISQLQQTQDPADISQGPRRMVALSFWRGAEDPSGLPLPPSVEEGEPVDGYPGSRLSSETVSSPYGEMTQTTVYFVSNADVVLIQVFSIPSDGEMDPLEQALTILEGMAGRGEPRPLEPCPIPEPMVGAVGPSFDGSNGAAPVEPVGPSFDAGQVATPVPR